MTTGDVARLFPDEEPSGASDATDVLKRLRDSVVELLARLDRAPRLVRVKADQVELEMEWADHGPGGQPDPAGPDSGGSGGSGGPGSGGSGGPDPGGGSAGSATGTERYVTAELVGVFYRAPAPGAQPFVEVGDVVEAGQQVGIVESMKLMIPVEAGLAGRVVDVLVADGASVEYGERLVRLEPAGG